MTKDKFKDLTAHILLLDGGTGSNLMAAGMPRGVCAEAWILDHRDVIQKLQKDYINAGSRVVYAPTFGANRVNLSRYRLEDHLEEMNRSLFYCSKEIVPDDVFIAGDLTTTGEMMEPAGSMTYETAFETYQEQAQILAECGVDLFVVETMVDITETLAALDAIMSVCDLPVMCSMTVQADGSLFTEGDAVEAATALEAAGADAVGVNCSVGPDQLGSVIRNIKDSVSIPVIAKPNAGTPTIDENGNALYHMLPGKFADAMKELTDAGASIIGGCCGTTPVFIRELALRYNLPIHADME